MIFPKSYEIALKQYKTLYKGKWKTFDVEENFLSSVPKLNMTF